ncbi:MAG: DUF6951 family protein [Spirochaetota bacterium]
MIVVEVDPGICGLPSTIRAWSENGRHVRLEITSACEDVRKLARKLRQVDGFSELYTREEVPPLYLRIREHCRHVACPVPLAVFKGIEAALGAALPRDVEIRIRREHTLHGG